MIDFNRFKMITNDYPKIKTVSIEPISTRYNSYEFTMKGFDDSGNPIGQRLILGLDDFPKNCMNIESLMLRILIEAIEKEGIFK